MAYFLITESNNWADEIDVEAFQLIKGESAESVIAGIVDQYEYPTEIYIGTNEEIEFETREDAVDTLVVQEITEEEFNSMSTLFGKTSFGTGALL
jgi:hypothetical protein